jgi:hypothetical protein
MRLAQMPIAWDSEGYPVRNPTGIRLPVLIVDAFNVLHASSKAGLGRIDVARLKALIAHSHWASEHVVLVFDGTGGRAAPGRGSLRHPADAGLDLESRGAGISEVYAGGGGADGSDADAVIESLLEREEQMGRGRLAIVVSSDKRVRAAATGARAKSITSDDFLERLAEDVRKAHERAKKKDGGRPEFATDAGADEGRTEYWLREFGVDGAGPEAMRSTARGAEPRKPRDAAGEAGGIGEEWREKIEADDLDMGKILRQYPPTKNTRDRDDHDGSNPARR